MRMHEPFEVPERSVSHDFDDDGEMVSGDLVGEAQTLPMDARAVARKHRERLNQLGGFGFGAPRT